MCVHCYILPSDALRQELTVNNKVSILTEVSIRWGPVKKRSLKFLRSIGYKQENLSYNQNKNIGTLAIHSISLHITV